MYAHDSFYLFGHQPFRALGLLLQTHSVENLSEVTAKVDSYALQFFHFVRTDKMDTKASSSPSPWDTFLEAELKKKNGKTDIPCPNQKLYSLDMSAPETLPIYSRDF